jgi:REP element-mobilizing transposase RayT
MSRLRKLRAGATYHASAIAWRHDKIFKNNDFRELFLKVMKDAKKKFNYYAKHILITDFSVHLFIKPGRHESLSDIMQWILGVFSMRFNRITGYSGTAWSSKYSSKIISGEMHANDEINNLLNDPESGEVSYIFKNNLLTLNKVNTSGDEIFNC